jgi:hypothetical protein
MKNAIRVILPNFEHEETDSQPHMKDLKKDCSGFLEAAFRGLLVYAKKFRILIKINFTRLIICGNM